MKETRYQFKPLGYYHSCFKMKTGTPRQSQLIKNAHGVIEIKYGSGDVDFVQGLEAFEYIWVVYVFHLNHHLQVQETDCIDLSVVRKAKIKPPRLNGEKVGVLSSRSPYRPNNLGMSVGKVLKIETNRKVLIQVSGLDLVDGTPVVDVKPYIPMYDSYPDAKIADWIENAPIEQKNVKKVSFLPESIESLTKLLPTCEYYDNVDDIKAVIVEMIEYDPRSKHKKQVASDEVVGFYVDKLNIRVIFSEDQKATVIEIEPIGKSLNMTNEELKERNVEDYKKYVAKISKQNSPPTKRRKVNEQGNSV